MNKPLFNRKAKFNYTIEESYSAGIMLTGNEVKSIRDGKLNFNDSYCLIVNGELWVRGLYISENKFGQQQDPTRDRKLLLKKREINKIETILKEKGFSSFPIKVFFNDYNIVKMDIGVGKGKKEYDKRETIKKRDSERSIRNLVTI
jgi:SsrA-binding protein